jgi:hypothetical protein
MNITNRILFRAVRGAVKDVANSHPNWKVSPSLVDSITKRLAGTLRGLGAMSASESRNALHDWRKVREGHSARGAATRRLLHFLGVQTGNARRENNEERVKAFVDVLRFLSKPRRNFALPRREIDPVSPGSNHSTMR